MRNSTSATWKADKTERIDRSIEMTEVSLKQKVEDALEIVRPHLQRDGGNVELVEVTDDGIVKVRLQGACSGCPMAAMTLQSGVARVIKQNVPEVKDIEAVLE